MIDQGLIDSSGLAGGLGIIYLHNLGLKQTIARAGISSLFSDSLLSLGLRELT